MVASNTVVPRTGQAGALITTPSGGGGAFGMVTAPDGSQPRFDYSGNVLNPGQATVDPLIYVGSPLFTLEAQPSCRLTYSGPDCLALVRCIVTLPVPFESGFNQLGISFSGDLDGKSIGAPETIPAGSQVAQFNTADTTCQLPLVCERLVPLTAGDTIGPVYGTQGGGSTNQCNGFSMSVQVVG